MSRIRKFLLSLVLILVGGCGLIFSGCNNSNYDKISLKLSDTQVSLTKVGNDLGESKTISGVVSGTKGDASKQITFVSANTEVATVKQVSFSGDTTTAVITAQNGGTTIIYAIAEGNVKKMINVSVVQEASQIMFARNYKPLIVRDEDFYIDINNVLIYPSATSDKSFEAKLYDLNDGYVATFENDVNGNYILRKDVTKNLGIGNYVLKIFKQTSKELLQTSISIAVKERIKAESFTLVDMDGNEIDSYLDENGNKVQMFNLSTNILKNAEGMGIEGQTSAKFKVRYTYSTARANGQTVTRYIDNYADFSYNFSVSDKYLITYHEALNGDEVESYYLIETKAKTAGEKISLDIAYVGFELAYNVTKLFDINITTYPENMQIVFDDMSKVTIGSDDAFSIYATEPTSFMITNIPSQTDANSLLIEITQSEFAKFSTFKINNQDVVWSSQIPVNVGDRITVQGVSAGDEIAFTVRNAIYDGFYKSHVIKVWDSVRIYKYYDVNGNELESSEILGAVGTQKEVYFTIENESEFVYFDGFSFVSGNDEFVTVSWSRTGLVQDSKTLFKLTISCLKNTQNESVTIYPKNTGTLGSKTLKIKIITAIDFEDQAGLNPRIYFVNDEIESIVNVASFYRNPNNGQIEELVLNDMFIDGEILKGDITLNLEKYPELANIKINKFIVTRLADDESISLYYTDEDQSYSFFGGKLTLKLKNGKLNIFVGENGWEENFSIAIEIECYNLAAEKVTTTKTIAFSAYKKINFSNLEFIDNVDAENVIDTVNLVSKNTAGENFELSFEKFNFRIKEASTLHAPVVSFSFAKQSNTRYVISDDGSEWTILQSAELTLMFREVSGDLFELYVFSNSSLNVPRFTDYIIATVTQNGVSYNKYLKATIVNNSVASALLIDDNYRVDESGNYYYIFKAGEQISLDNKLLPSGVQSKIHFEVLQGNYLSVVEENGEQHLVATGAGINGKVKIYSTDSKEFNVESLINHLINNTDVTYEDVNSLSKIVIVRVEDGSEDAPYSIFDTQDFYRIYEFNTENKVYFEIKSDLNLSFNDPSQLPAMNNIVLNGNNHTVSLINSPITSISNSEIKNLTFVLGDNELIKGTALNTTFNNLAVYCDGEFIISKLENSNVRNSTFYRNILTENVFGIAKTLENSEILANKIEFTVKTQNELSLFAGFAQSMLGSTIANNDIYFYQTFGEEKAINISSNGKGAFIAIAAVESNVTNNAVLSYYDGKTVRSFGEFAGLVHTSYGSRFELNSIFADFDGAAAIFNIYLNDEERQNTYSYTSLANNNFVVSNGANGKLVNFAGQFVDVFETNSKNLIYKNGNDVFEVSFGANWHELTNIKHFYTYADGEQENEIITHYFAFNGEKFYKTSGDFAFLPENELQIVESKDGAGENSIFVTVDGSWTTYEWFDGSQWHGLIDMVSSHYFYLDGSTPVYVYANENTAYKATDNSFSTVDEDLTFVTTKKLVYNNGSGYEALISGEWKELNNFTYYDSTLGITYTYVEQQNAQNAAWGYGNEPNKLAGLVQSSIYFNVGATNFDSQKLAIASKNLFVRDLVDGQTSSVLNEDVIKLTPEAFANASNFSSWSAAESLYNSLSFTRGRYKNYYIYFDEVKQSTDITYYDQNWSMTSEKPVLVRSAGDSVVEVKIEKASTIDFEKLNIVKEATKGEGASAETAYLYLLPDGFTLGGTLKLENLFKVKIDGAESQNYDFVISDTSNFEKTKQNLIKVNGYGKLKITIYSKTNAAVTKDIILYVYENNLGNIYSSKTGEEIVTGGDSEGYSTIKVRDGENFSFYVVSDGAQINLNCARVGALVKVGTNVYTIVPSSEGDLITKSLNVDDFDFAFEEGSFIVSTYTGATNASIAFEKNEFTKIDVVNATVEITTDQGEITEQRLLELLTVSFDEQLLPELSMKILDRRVSSEVIQGVTYTTTYFDIQFYFSDYDVLVDNNNTGSYTISLAIDDQSDTKQLTLNTQKILTNDFAHYVQSGDATSTVNTSIYEINERPAAYITPGANSMLDLFVYPYFADFDSAKITSSRLTNTKGVSIGLAFEQKCLNLDTGFFENLSATPIVDGLILQKASTKSSDADAFNGHFYIKTLLTSDDAYYLATGNSFVVTITLYNGETVVKTIDIEILVESIKPVDITVPEYLAAGVETEIEIGELSEENAQLSFEKYLVVNGEETQTFNNYITGPYKRDGKWFISVDINVFNISSIENPKIELKLKSVVTKAIKGIVQTATKTVKGEIKKYVINSIDMVYDSSYMTSQYLSLNYKVNATYFKYSTETAGVKGGKQFTEEVEALLFGENGIQTKLNNPANYIDENGDLTHADAENVPFSFSFTESDTWAWKLNKDGKHLDDSSKPELKIYSLVEGTNLNFEVTFTFDYEDISPTWPLHENMNGRKTKSFTAAMTPTMVKDVTEDAPDAIRTTEQFLNMKEGAHYRLVSNIILTNYAPFELKCASLDGNGYVIYVKNFDVDLDDASNNLQISLFSSVSAETLVKNVIVAYDSMTFNVQNAKTVSFAGFAITNAGTIYNSEVLAMSIPDEEAFTSNSTSPITSQEGPFISEIKINVPDDFGIAAKVSGFVLNNTGNISNSRVGRTTESFKFSTSLTVREDAIVGHFAEAFEPYIKDGNGFKFTANGEVSGFVNQNGNSNQLSTNATIVSCYAANIGIENLLNDTSLAKTAGFVVSNYGVINGCFVYGQKTKPSEANNFKQEVSFTNSTITSATHVGGFAYENQNTIENSLSNVKIITNAISAGFSYINSESALIEQCISLCKSSQSLINSPFVGHNGLESKNKGTVKNCYYLDEDRTISPSTEDKTAAALKSIYELSDSDNYSGFAFGDIGLSTWIIDDSGKPMLISANEIAVTHYVLLNASMNQYMDNATDSHPYVIDKNSSWHKYLSTLVREISYNDGQIIKQITGSYRLIKNITISNDGFNKNELSYYCDFAGRFDGNGLTVSGVTLKDESALSSIGGLFASINITGKSNVVIKDLNISFSKVSESNSEATIDATNSTVVGGLAGIINNAKIYNISLQGGYEVCGRYFAGGLAGIIVGEDTIINNIKNTLSARVTVTKYIDLTSTLSSEEKEAMGLGEIETITHLEVLQKYIVGSGGVNIILQHVTGNTTESGQNVNVDLIIPVEKPKYYGFAGSIAAIVDIGKLDNGEASEEISSEGMIKGNIVNTRSTSVKRVVGTYVGGMFGLVGKSTFVHDSGFIANAFDPTKVSNQYLIAYNTVGGIAGINFGLIRYGFIEHENQTGLDEALFSEDKLESNVNLFRINTNTYNPTVYVGGIAGINCVYPDEQSNNSGIIKDSYSKVAVLPAFNNKDINGKFDEYYDQNSNFYINENAPKRMVGGLVGLMIGTETNPATVETSFSTAQTAGEVAGGIIGEIRGNVSLILVNALNVYVNDPSATTDKNKNYYPSTLTDRNDEAYFAKNSQSVKYGMVVGNITSGSKISLEGRSVWAASGLEYKLFGKNADASIDYKDEEFTNLNGDLIPVNLVEITILDGVQTQTVATYTLQNLLANVEYFFGEFSEVSDADWVLTNFNELKKIPYPNFGVVTNLTITNEEEFWEILEKPTAHYTVLPSSANTIVITSSLWEAIAQDFTGSLKGISTTTDENNNPVYPTIRLVFATKIDGTNVANIALFKNMRRSSIENLNIEFIIAETDLDYANNFARSFGGIATNVVNSTIKNVTVKMSSLPVSVSGTPYNAQQQINVNNFKYFGGIAARVTGTTIENCHAEINIVSGSNDACTIGNRFIGGIAGLAENTIFVNDSFGSDQTTVSIAAESTVDHFGGIVAETTKMANSSISGCSTTLASLELNNTETIKSYVGGIVGHASADYDTADLASGESSGASIVDSSVTINKLSTLQLTNENLKVFYLGGIAGLTNANIAGETNTVSINLVGVSAPFFGGATGYQLVNISGVVAQINVYGSNIIHLGGVVGCAQKSLAGIDGLTTHNRAAVFDQILSLEITNCAATLNVVTVHSNTNNYFIDHIGGIIATSAMREKIQQCFANVNLENANTARWIGGIVGEAVGSDTSDAKSQIVNCYTAGKISKDALISNEYGAIGGLVGLANTYDCYLHMENCYNVCEIGTESDFADQTKTTQSEGANHIGLLIGTMYDAHYTFKNNFAIRECNMELYPVGTKEFGKTGAPQGSTVKENEPYSGISTIFISEFYKKVNDDDYGFVPASGSSLISVWFVPTSEDFEGVVCGLPQIAAFSETIGKGTDLAENFAHELGSRLNPIENDLAKNTYIPEEYQQVEYIESTGTQRIKTGVVGAVTINGTFQFTTTEVNSWWDIIKSVGSPAGRTYGIEVNYPTNTRLDVYQSAIPQKHLTFDTEIHTYNETFNVNTAWDTEIGEWILFQNSCHGRLYSFKMYQDGFLVRNFVPCVRISDGTVGLYDKVTETFFTNSGSGTFIVGPNETFCNYIITDSEYSNSETTSASNSNSSKVSALPSEYQEVEYIESTGTQYIDTGVLATTLNAVELEQQLTNRSERQEHGCTYYTSNAETNTIYVVRAMNNQFIIQAGRGGTDAYFGATDFNRHLFYFNIAEQQCNIDDTSKNNCAFSTWNSAEDYTFHLFARKAYISGTLSMQNYCYCKLFKCKIWDTNNTLVRNFVPCYRKSDNVIGLYDLVNDEFYTNSGTGTFLKGADVVLPDAYQEVEYIESTGTQYIDTGVVPNQSTIIRSKLSMSVLGGLSQSRIGGASASSNGLPSVLVGALSGGTIRWVFGNTIHNISYGLQENEFFEFRLSFQEMQVNGEIYSDPEDTFSAVPYNLYISAVNIQGSTYNQYGSLRIKYFSITDDGTLVRNFIPCYRKSDGVVGLYDLVTKTFFTNSGSGTFAKGADVKEETTEGVQLSGLNGWLVFNTTSEELSISGTTGSNAVISGINAEKYVGGDLTLNGIMTNCTFGTSGHDGLTGENAVVKALGSAYIEDVEIYVNSSSMAKGYFINSIKNSAKIKSVHATGSAASGLINDIWGSPCVVLDEIQTNVSINSTADADACIGGIIGWVRDDSTAGTPSVYITNSYNRGDVTCTYTGNSSGCGVGGLVAFDSSANININNCFNIGKITCVCGNSTTEFYVGGIAGRMAGTISNCFNAGFIQVKLGSGVASNSHVYAAGLVGNIPANSAISDSYSASMKSDLSTGFALQPIVGVISGGTLNLTNVYYAQDLIFNETNIYGTGCDYAEIKQRYSGGKWQTSTALPYLAIGEFATGNLDSIAGSLGILGTLFAPHVVNDLPTANSSAVYYLSTDLTKSSATGLSSFMGILLGGNHTIHTKNTTLLSSVGNGARIIGLNIDLTLNDFELTSTTYYLGSLLNTVAVDYLYLNNIQSTINGTVVKNKNVTNIGGLIGWMKPGYDAKIVGCGVSGMVSVKNETQQSNNYLAVGGIVSNIESLAPTLRSATMTISKCYSTLSVVDVYKNFSIDSVDFGGIAAWAWNNITLKIKDCYYAGYLDIYTNTYTKFGSFVGTTTNNNGGEEANSVNVTNCYDAGVYYVRTANSARARLATCPSGGYKTNLTITNCFVNNNGNIWSYYFPLTDNWDITLGVFYNVVDGKHERTQKTYTWMWSAETSLPTLTWQYDLGAENLVYGASSGSLDLPDIGGDNAYVRDVYGVKLNWTGVVENNGTTFRYNGTTVKTINTTAENNVSGTNFGSIGWFKVDGEKYFVCLNDEYKQIGVIKTTETATSLSKNYNGNGFYIATSVPIVNEFAGKEIQNLGLDLTSVDLGSGTNGKIGGFANGSSSGEIELSNIWTGSTVSSNSVALSTFGTIIGYTGADININGTIVNNINAENIYNGPSANGGFVGAARNVTFNQNSIAINNGNISANYAAMIGGMFGTIDNFTTPQFIGSIIHPILINNGNITSGGYEIGGVVGRCRDVSIESGIIINNGNVNSTAINNYSPYAAGAIGCIFGNLTISNLTYSNNGTITNSVYNYAGGFTAYVSGTTTITNSTIDNNGSVTSLENAGGLVGYVKGAVNINKLTFNNNNTISASASTSYAGGMIGKASGLIDIKNSSLANSFAVSANSSAGGIIGTVGGGVTIDSSSSLTNGKSTDHSIGSVSGEIIGGLIGNVDGALTTSGTLTNYANVTTNTTCGGLIGVVQGAVTLKGTLENSGVVYSQAPTADTFTGGIIAIVNSSLYIEQVSGTTTTIRNNGEVKNNNSSNNADRTYVGGFVGLVAGSVTISGKVLIENNNKVSTTSGSNSIIGGIFGNVSSATISISSGSGYGMVNSGEVAGGFHPSGGIFGGRNGSITITSGNVSNSGKVSSTIYAGGIVGEGVLTITGGEVSNSGQIIATTDGAGRGDAGGIAGRIQGDFIISGGSVYNTASISATDTAGGIVGRVLNSLTISGGNVYNTGSVTATSGDAGGIAGSVVGEAFIYGNNTTVLNGSNIVVNSAVDKGNAGRIQGTSAVGGIIGRVGTTNVNDGGGLLVIGSANTNLTNPTAPTVQNCGVLEAIANVTATLGGLVGYTGADSFKTKGGNITNYGRFSANGNACDVIGGIAGRVSGSLHLEGGNITVSLYNSGGIDNTNNNYAGGIIGCVGRSGHSGTVDVFIYISLTNNVTVKGVQAGGIIGEVYDKNITINASLTNNGSIVGSRAGGIIGWCNNAGKSSIVYGGTTQNVILNKGAIDGSMYSGGIIGCSNGFVVSGNTIQIDGNNTFSIVLKNEGSITGSGDSGGIIGTVFSSGADFYICGIENVASVTGHGAGGIIGYASKGIYVAGATIQNRRDDPNQNYAKITATSGHAGGLFGSSSAVCRIDRGTLSNSGNVVSSSYSAGGIFGNVDGLIKFSDAQESGNVNISLTNTGTIYSEYSHAGGLFGSATNIYLTKGTYSNRGNVEAARTYNSAGSGNAGGIVGYVANDLIISTTVNVGAQGQGGSINIQSGQYFANSSQGNAYWSKEYNTVDVHNAGGVAGKVAGKATINGGSVSVGNTVIRATGSSAAGGIFGEVNDLSITGGTTRVTVKGIYSYRMNNNDGADACGVVGYIKGSREIRNLRTDGYSPSVTVDTYSVTPGDSNSKKAMIARWGSTSYNGKQSGYTYYWES